MPVARRRGAQRLDDEQLLRGVREMVVAADHMGDLEIDVVDRDREVVQGRPVGAGDDEIVHRAVRGPDLAEHEVLERGVPLVRDPQAHSAAGLLLAAEPTVVAMGRLPGLDVVAGGLER